MGSETPFGQERFALRINLDLCIHALWLLMWALANLFFFFFSLLLSGALLLSPHLSFHCLSTSPINGRLVPLSHFFSLFSFLFFFFFPLFLIAQAGVQDGTNGVSLHQHNIHTGKAKENKTAEQTLHGHLGKAKRKTEHGKEKGTKNRKRFGKRNRTKGDLRHDILY